MKVGERRRGLEEDGESVEFIFHFSSVFLCGFFPTQLKLIGGITGTNGGKGYSLQARMRNADSREIGRAHV